jgi:hypothetical protein
MTPTMSVEFSDGLPFKGSLKKVRHQRAISVYVVAITAFSLITSVPIPSALPVFIIAAKPTAEAFSLYWIQSLTAPVFANFNRSSEPLGRNLQVAYLFSLSRASIFRVSMNFNFSEKARASRYS